MSSIPCPVDGCIKDVSRAGYCYGHYMKNWRYGTPTPDHGPNWQDLRGQRFGDLTVADERVGNKWACTCDCGRTSYVRAGDLNRGSITTCGNRTVHHRLDVVGYNAVHDRLRNDRGAATAHRCVDCDGQASHWSYDHEDPDELLRGIGSASLAAYSLKQRHYHPRCVPCHKTFDLDKVNSFAT